MDTCYRDRNLKLTDERCPALERAAAVIKVDLAESRTFVGVSGPFVVPDEVVSA